jgi:salicylate hydroxylase
MNRKARPRVIVVGAGIGGLGLAALLAQQRTDVTVYEQANEIRPVGAGVFFAPNGAKVLRRITGGDPFCGSAGALKTGWEFRRWRDSRVLSAQRLGDECVRLYGEHTYGVHRADLLSVLLAHLPEGCLTLGAKVVWAGTSDNAAVVHFADGSSDTADVVVGADGIHSVVQPAVVDAPGPRFSGLCVHRCLIPADRVPEFARRASHTVWLGPGRHVVHYPVSGGKLINLAAMTPAGDWRTESWSAAGSLSDLAAEFQGWDHRLRELIDSATSTARSALFDRDPLPRWTQYRLALLGDAAHPMLPFLAQGSAQALEDATVLARCLTASNASFQDALARYEGVRLTRASRVQTASRERAGSNHLPDGPAQRARDAAFVAGDPLAASGWLYGYDANTVQLSAAVDTEPTESVD